MMKLILLFLFPALAAFGQTPFKDGKYVNEKEMVYAIEIYNEGTAIKMYLRDKEGDKADYSLFNTGTIDKVRSKYFVQRLDGTKFSKRRMKELRIQMKNGEIVMPAYALLNDFYDQFTVYSDDIHYKPITN